jgi:hypothetical protein
LIVDYNWYFQRDRVVETGREDVGLPPSIVGVARERVRLAVAVFSYLSEDLE